MSTEKLPEPAVRSYFFGKGYRDLAATIRASWEKNLASAAKEFKAAAGLFPEHWGAKGLGVLRGSAGVSILLFGTVCFLAFSLVHVALLLLLFLLVYLGFSVLYLAERLYIAVKGFFSVCPECHEKMPLAHYLCPRCGEVHRRLIPSSYGILRRTCLCGEKLPTTFWGGRGAIPARCPWSECQHLLSASIAESRKHFIPIYGGPAVGKSAFLVSGVSELIDQMPSRGFECFFL
ncbi:MAG: transposase, partial [Acidobacteria bacterium]|nr:transposase [Acidobacteriota bacterium]